LVLQPHTFRIRPSITIITPPYARRTRALSATRTRRVHDRVRLALTRTAIPLELLLEGSSRLDVLGLDLGARWLALRGGGVALVEGV
jgi:hypothetical protein